MKRIATVATVLIGVLAATPALAGGKSSSGHTHYCNCGDSIGAKMCASSSSSSSSSSSGGSTSSSSGGTTTSSSSGGTTTSSSSGGTTTSSTTSSSSGGTTVPEPGMVGLMGLGFVGLAISRRRRA